MKLNIIQTETGLYNVSIDDRLVSTQALVRLAKNAGIRPEDLLRALDALGKLRVDSELTI
jgi:hypothetical protein